MLRVRECVLLFLILATALSLEDKELKKEELKDEGQKKKELEREELKKEELKKEGLKNDELDEFSSSRIGRYFFDIFGGANKCQNPENCPPHACRLDDAVVHGFCCGCARLSAVGDLPRS
ncbi:hypothetical protein J6590_027097 [Homalodisca vitripennis]|nr:hypothetical protein J6590_027097 [Homalodisca vitripennis]